MSAGIADLDPANCRIDLQYYSLERKTSHRCSTPTRYPCTAPSGTCCSSLLPPALKKTNVKLLGAGADPSRWTSNGMTPLAAGILAKNTKSNPTLGPPLVRALAEAGADVNGVSSFNGFSPLHYACYEGACRQLVESLLDAGAGPRAPCAGLRFMTPLQLAGTSGNAEAVVALLGRLGDGALNDVGAPPSRCVKQAWGGRQDH